MAALIDAHHNVWDLSVRDQPWLAADGLGPIRRTCSLDDLRSHALAAGITSTVPVQTVTIADETPDG
jgi:L-fuconolactonase